MTTIDLHADDFSRTVTDNEMVLVDFWASWCGPCRMFAPAFEQASEKHPGIALAKVDTEAELQPAAAARISSIPTLMAFKQGHLVYSQPGALPAPALEQLIGELERLDLQPTQDSGERAS
jgi:thioredoxin